MYAASPDHECPHATRDLIVAIHHVEYQGGLLTLPAIGSMTRIIV